MFAVIKTGGKQYRVSADDEITIERLTGEAGDTLEFNEVLMIGGAEAPLIGTPIVDGASVAAEIVRQARGDRIIIFKKRRRQNSRRRNGHRQDLTVIKITDILIDGKAAPKKAKKAAPKDEPKKAEASADAAPAALFDAPAGEPDDLKKISGVGPVLEKKLNALGITKYAQVAAFSADDIGRVDDALSFKGRIDRDNWVEQAATLAADSDA
ncbi:MAG: 50S ribosomal protein L21 [Hyphomicrobiales bacterium]|nr:50S ribosomal protein L21 [Hyphomicrobiales bacterium]PCJ94728.1 MAG: 50S ribosomal protein L21 [Hyphomicrobiales bacterium]